MRLRSLTVKQLNGLPDGRQLDGVQDGITMLIGPNASGKSRLAAALLTVMDPNAASNEAPVVTATFESQGVTYTAQRTGGGLTWMRDGQQIEPPIAPQDAVRHFVHLRDLMSLGGPNAEVLERLQVELAGGFDLHKLRQAIGAQAPNAKGRKQPGGKEAGTLQQALDAVTELQTKRNALADDERKIKTWEAEAAKLKAQADRKDALAAALEYLEADAQRAAAHTAADTVPNAAVYRNASDDVWTQVHKALDDLSRSEQERSRKQSAEHQAQREVDRLDASGVSVEQTDAWLEEVEAARGP